MIDQVHFENFKSLKNVSIELGRLTVLVGPNGCGKSSVLQGIQLLSQAVIQPAPDSRIVIVPRDGLAVAHRFSALFSGLSEPERLASPGRPTSIKLSMRNSIGDELTLTILLPGPSAEGPSRADVHSFEMVVDGPSGHLSANAPRIAAEDTALPTHPRVKQFASAVYLNLNANKMCRTSVPETETPRMHSDGGHLASTLAWMKGAAEDELAQITLDLAKVVPGVKRIRTLRERLPRRRMEKVNVDGQPVWRPVDETLLGDRFEIEFDEGPSIPADLLSEGTVLALGLLTKLHEPERPRLVLLDDIDRGLHIEAQAKLVQVLRNLLGAEPDLQIVCTTHSPYLLDLLDPSEVRVLALEGDRHTRAVALTAHPEFDKWKFGTQTGELWAALGSAWVTAVPGSPE